MRSCLTLVIAVVALGTVAGCGSGDGASSPPTSTRAIGSGSPAPSVPFRAPAPRLPRGLGLPSGVPTRSDGTPADAVSARVIRKWSGALSGGDIRRAARFFALPSQVQNGTPVFTLNTAGKRLVFNLAFPCGARPTTLERGTDGYTIVDFVLVERVGGDCGGGAGGTARSAIRVRDGHIVDWFRIPERGARPQPSPVPEAQPGTQIA